MSLVMLTPEEAEKARKEAEAEFREAFLREVERRAGASRGEMLKIIESEQWATNREVKLAALLHLILGEKP